MAACHPQAALKESSPMAMMDNVVLPPRLRPVVKESVAKIEGVLKEAKGNNM